MHCQPYYRSLRWDIFCRVIDNFGDLGVAWRLAVNLAQRGQQVRLWIDDTTALEWLAPEGACGIQVCPWAESENLTSIATGDILLETFGCDITPEYVAGYVRQISDRGQKCIWINLEYLSAERYVERCHQLPSPIMSGPGAGQTRHFFYPGFTPATGGLLREIDLLQRQRAFDRSEWLTHLGVDWQGKRLIALFCYEPEILQAWLEELIEATVPTCLLITAGRASAACQLIFANENMLQRLLSNPEQLSFFYLPKLSQIDFDHLLWACDVNFVRGEDSLVRALWAGKPLIWQIYPQADGAHRAKLNAFLDWLVAPPAMRAFHQIWNGNPDTLDTSSKRPVFEPSSWLECTANARERLLLQNDLTSSLLSFITKNN